MQEIVVQDMARMAVILYIVLLLAHPKILTKLMVLPWVSQIQMLNPMEPSLEFIHKGLLLEDRHGLKFQTSVLIFNGLANFRMKKNF
jgi:hypothetical protein